MVRAVDIDDRRFPIAKPSCGKAAAESATHQVYPPFPGVRHDSMGQMRQSLRAYRSHATVNRDYCVVSRLVPAAKRNFPRRARNNRFRRCGHPMVKRRVHSVPGRCPVVNLLVPVILAAAASVRFRVRDISRQAIFVSRFSPHRGTDNRVVKLLVHRRCLISDWSTVVSNVFAGPVPWSGFVSNPCATPKASSTLLSSIASRTAASAS